MKWDTEGAFSYSEQLRQHDYPIFYQKKNQTQKSLVTYIQDVRLKQIPCTHEILTKVQRPSKFKQQT